MARPAETKEVVIVQITCPHYRVPFFCGLHERLERHGVALRLLYGVSETYGADMRANLTDLPWAEPFMPWILPIRSATLEPVIWHPILRRVRGADLIVTEAASRYLINYLLYAVHALGGPRLAFWGHGWNHFLDNRNSRAERLKHWLGKRADWYFAYTSEVKQGLVERGYAPARITDVQNAVESPPPCELTEQQRAALRKGLGIGPSDPVALYCGRMYGAKRLDFLLDAAEAAHRDLPSFHLVVIGGGPDEAMVREAARQRSYVHFAGASFGKRKHELFAISRMLALPGRVGLGVVDAFHHGVPPVASRYPYHSPEVCYLKDGENGLVSEDDTASFAQAMVRLATDDGLYASLASGCAESARSITMDEMIGRFADGVVAALGSKPRPG
jgi:glycosyltransferase involved in cell wall biosynthesis